MLAGVDGGTAGRPLHQSAPTRYVPRIRSLFMVRGQLARWQEAGLAVDGVAVNVSPARFYQDELVAHVSPLLDQHALLRDAGCTPARGYWYGQPMPAAAFEDWLARRQG